jgi:hypothetical protein
MYAQMTTLAWKLNRIRLMGMPEVLWRTRQLLQKKATKAGIGLALSPPAPNVARYGKAFIQDAQLPAGSVATLRLAADQVLHGRWNVFAMRGIELGFPPKWNRDPKTGTDAPMGLGKAIDYRNERVVGDIKYLWEPSRHLELVTLALAYRQTGEAIYADGARTLLQSWFDQCPYPQGVHWTSSLELAVRLVNWACAWQLLGGEQFADESFRRAWLDKVYQHCHFIAGYFSRHSSANNHLFGEYMGLYIAAHVWPCWPASAGWRRIAKRGLEREALAQNHADGVNKEQALYYHHEVMDMMLLCHLTAQANGDSFSEVYLDRLERMAEFLCAVMDVDGNVPMSGDADDARMVRLSGADDECPYRSLLASCALLFGRGDFKNKAGRLDDKNRWLFGRQGEAAWGALPDASAAPVMAFPLGGHYLLGHRFNTPREVRLVADCAPLGYLSIAAHGHADALAFTLSVAGDEILVDPGTYAYHTQKRWRDYFRSTRAHNTVTVDGLDQSEVGGPFMWMRKARARLLRHRVEGEVQVFEGEHDGYMRLPDPVLHRRCIQFDRTEERLIVADVLQCRASHAVELHWHLSEACSVEHDGRGCTVRTPRATLELTSPPGFELDILRASESPISGWISRTFDAKSPINTVRLRGTVRGNTEVVTSIAIRVGRAM